MKIAHRLGLSWYQTVPIKSVARTVLAAGSAGVVASLAMGLPHPAMRLAAGGLLFAPVYAAIVVRWEIVPHAELRAIFRRFIPGYH